MLLAGPKPHLSDFRGPVLSDTPPEVRESVGPVKKISEIDTETS